MTVSRLWSIASAEIRSCRRLARTWVVAVVAMLCGSFMWLFLSLAHMFASYISASAGLTGPHFAIVHIGKFTLLSFTVGIVFLAFDIRQRDIRDRIGDAIAVRPMSNFELITGRLIGIVLLLAIPVGTLIVLMCGYGLIAEFSNLGFGSAMDPVSVAAFLVWDLVPNLFFWGALTMLVAVVVRQRMVAVVIMLVLLFGYYYLSSGIPFYLGSALATYTGGESLPSTLAPQFFNVDVVFNRIYTVLFSLGLIGLASTIYPRQAKLQERQFFLITGCAAVVISIFGIYALVNSKLHKLDEVDRWASIHKEFQTHADTNIEAIRGSVDIFPGRSIHLDLVLSLETTRIDSSDDWLLSMNPGYRIVNIELNGQQIQDYDFKDGLLSMPKQDTQSALVEMRLVAKGVPDPMFAYLDSSLKWKDLNYVEAIAARRFGTKSYIFHPQIVALVPGVSWFPSSGSAYGRNNGEARPQDFFDIDISVSVPRHWIVAGPGSRTREEHDKRARFRFNPTNPVSEVALVGSDFERRALTIEGTTFELLMSKKHTDNLDTLNAVVPALKEWIEERMTLASELGLSYPYKTLSFVEVPHLLRTYGGDWNMQSVFSPPGIQMFRESGLPIARFDNVINTQSDELTGDNEKLGDFLLELLTVFFENDFEGGSPFLNLGRNLVSHQTKPEGSGASAMEYFVGELAHKLIFDLDGYFSIHSSLEGNRAAEQVNSLISAGGDFDWTPRLNTLEWRDEFSDRPSVWERALGTALSNLNYEKDPKMSLHALLLKTDANTQLVLDVVEHNVIGSFLHDLVAQYGGMTYTEEDLHNIALAAGLDVSNMLGDWLHSTDAPGLILTDAKFARLETSESIDSMFQTSFLLRNNEAVPAYVSITYGEEGEIGLQKMTPIRVSGNTTLQVAIQTIDHPGQVSVIPYFSRNRNPLTLKFFDHHDDNTQITSESLPYISEVDWKPQETDAIIIDDLDPGFSAASGEDSVNNSLLPKWVTYMFGAYDTVLETDHGMLQLHDASDSLIKDVFNSVLWYRDSEPTSYGRYRHTYVISFQESKRAQLTFSADIPASGRWKLELHMPAIKWKQYQSRHSPGLGSIYYRSRPFPLAEIQLEVKNSGLSKTISFDAQEENSGWNDLGLFDLDAGTVDVVLTPQSDGKIVGDAIQWNLEREEN